MRIEVLYFEGCNNSKAASDLVRTVAAEHGLEACVHEVIVHSQEEAVRLKFLGSPTVLIDGLDVDPEARCCRDYAMGCRLYDGSGLPSASMIAKAIREAATRHT